MSVISICNYNLSTTYSGRVAKEKFEEALRNYIENMDEDLGFHLEVFIEDLIDNYQNFDILSQIENDNVDFEYNEEKVDNFVEDTLITYHDGDDNYLTFTSDEEGY